MAGACDLEWGMLADVADAGWSSFLDAENLFPLFDLPMHYIDR
jgi:hypothetical protein